jgi:hypothetical protein
MNDQQVQLSQPKRAATPRLMALELKGFAEGVQVLAEQIEAGQQEHATKDQQVAAEQAALALLRNTPIARRAIGRLEAYADEFTEQAAKQRDELMTAFFGPDKA